MTDIEKIKEYIEKELDESKKDGAGLYQVGKIRVCQSIHRFIESEIEQLIEIKYK